MPMIDITEQTISQIPLNSPRKKEIVYWDNTMKGFGIRVTQLGIRTFVIRFQDHGRQYLRSLGELDEIGIAEAKTKAQQLMDETKGQWQNGTPFREFAHAYMRLYAKEHKKSWKLDQQRIDNYLIPRFEKFTLTEIKRKDVIELLSEVGKDKPIAANRLREMMVRMFELAKSWEYTPETWANPAKYIKDFRENQRTRWLTPEEVQRLCYSLHSEEHSVKVFFKLLILTSLRKSNLLHATWSNVDLVNGKMYIPETKNGKPFTLKLSEHSIKLFKELPRTNKFCFAGKIEGKCRNTVDKAWRRIRERADLDEVHIHDLRKTGPSWMVQTGYSIHTIAKVLHHSSPRSTEIYAHLADSNVIDAINAFNSVIIHYMNEELEGTVTSA